LEQTAAHGVVGLLEETTREIPMLSMTKLALAAALVLGAASAASANDNDRNDQGGYRVGPLGQSFEGANPAYHPSMRREMRHGYGAYAFAPDYRFPYRHHRGWDGDWN
jgi:opacity protein-like surface antigen